MMKCDHMGIFTIKPGSGILLLFYVLLYVSSFVIILMEKRELVAWLSLSSLCLVIVVWLFLAAAMGLSAVCDCSIF